MENQTIKLDIWPPFRLMIMSWVLVMLIFILPDKIWGNVLSFILGFYLIFGVLRASFSKMWSEYVSMGAFVTMQTIWFIGLLWSPESLWFLRLAFSFLIILGINTKIYQIKNINKGLGGDLKSS